MTRTDPPADADCSALVQRLLDDGPIGMTAAARLLGTFRGGRPTHPSTLVRWVQRGVALAGGGVIKLEAFRLNGRLVTSQAAVVRFITAQQSVGFEGTPPPVERPMSRRCASEAAAAELARRGC